MVADPTGNQVLLGHKGAPWLRLTAQGRSAHGSRPDLGINALARLADAAVRIHGYNDWPHSETHGAATVNVGVFRAGTQPNLVPDHAELDIRTVPGFTSHQAISAIRQLAGPDIDVDAVLDLSSVATDPDDSLVHTLAEALRPADSGQSAQYATYFTDASVLTAKLGSPAVILYGPGDP
ncbi:peptidase dimerization domain-containing protein [Actinomadura sp. NAK00032]|uniref:peptidase dimerization domain-containing protein n=1 Tax=Actinomadura sp. NAK00032 TaxID=2742128 RepID=UPI001C3759F1|nr:peptidase dimerization domain-containing protein [Actinomadura sp. NAK00032]